MGFLSSIGKALSTTLDYISAPLAKPVTTFTKGISAGAAEVKAQRETGLTVSQGLKQIGVIAGTTAIAAGAVLAAAPASATGAAGAAVRSAVISTAKAAVPTTTKGKIIAAVAAPVVIGAVIREPAATAKVIAQAPSQLAQFGGDVAGFAANPSVESAKQIVKESPIISAAVGVVVAGAAAAAILPAISSARQTAAIKEQTEVIGGIGVVDKSQGYFDTPASNNSPIPQTPATETMKTGTTATRKRRKTAKQPMNISQKVNIAISNRSNSQTKRYLNVLTLPQSYGRIR
jgi:hypothetical protein